MRYKCKRCGREFEAKHKTAVCQDCHTAVCVVCGKEFELQWPWTQKTCSAKCRAEYVKSSGIAKERTKKASQTLKDRYGVDNAQKLQVFKRKCKYCGKEFETTNTRQVYCDGPHYGKCPVCGKQVEIKDMSIGPQACSEKCRLERIYKTNLERYGCKDSVNSDHAKQLAKKTCLEKYGVDHYSKSDEYKEKFKKTMIERYGTTVALRNDLIKQKLEKTCLEKYGVKYNCMREECRSSYRTISKVNLAFKELLDLNNIDCQQEFPLDRYSYDFKVGDTLIEIDPSITHNSYMSIFKGEGPTDIRYHINKTLKAKESGYRCIHVFDWDNWESIVDLVRPCEVIYGRQCEVKLISREQAVEFTEVNHISGSCNGQRINYGLFYDDQIVEVMTFGTPRYNKKYDLELLRLCSLRGFKVVGGASKLFSAFLKDNCDKSVISYCDASKFNGGVYEKIGMKFVHQTDTNKVWSRDDKYITQNLLNQRGYDQLFGTSFGKGSSNEELMLKNGWLPIYDCGQYVFEYVS